MASICQSQGSHTLCDFQQQVTPGEGVSLWKQPSSLPLDSRLLLLVALASGPLQEMMDVQCLPVKQPASPTSDCSFSPQVVLYIAYKCERGLVMFKDNTLKLRNLFEKCILMINRVYWQKTNKTIQGRHGRKNDRKYSNMVYWVQNHVRYLVISSSYGTKYPERCSVQ